jgi:Immunoglobulin domain
MNPIQKGNIVATLAIVCLCAATTTFAATSSADSNIITVDTRGAAITSQPASQTAQSGNDVTFSVAATGISPLTYQWLKNGVNIPDATNVTLTLNSVSAFDSDGYSVVVSNPYGSVTSATAYLAVLDDGANGTKPAQPTASPLPAKPSSVKNLVFVTHGWQSILGNPGGPPPQPWMVEMTNDIVQQLIASGQSSEWQVEAYYWLNDAWTFSPEAALNYGISDGTQIGKQIAGESFQFVHLIAHSAGAGLIQAIADQLETSPSPPAIQMTFLDPYVGLIDEYQSVYGHNATWSDCYYVEDGTGGFTSGNLVHAFNVDVSWVDPLHTPAPYLGPGGGEVALSSHGYPIDFYIQSIINTDPHWCGASYGYALSKEKDGAFWINNLANDPVGTGPFLPCSPADAVQNPNPGIAGLEAVANGIPDDISALNHAVGDATYSVVNGAGFEMQSLWSALPLVKTGGAQPMGETFTNTPAWLAIGLTITNPVNFVQFDAAFTDTNSAQGLLTVYWNTNQIGFVDERVAARNSQTYRFLLPGAVTNGLYTLSFRLDSFANSSSVAVTNVTTGFVGVAQPFTLAVSLTNGVPRLQLTGPSGYNYLVQTSTNLVDWTPLTLLANTSGTVLFLDTAATNSSQQFYRAVLFSVIAAPPMLQARVSGKNLILSWPSTAQKFSLQTTTNLVDPNSWVTLTNVPSVVNLQNTVTNPIAGSQGFYRLKQ